MKIGTVQQINSRNLDLLQDLNDDIENLTYYTIGITYDEKDSYFSGSGYYDNNEDIPKIRKYKFLNFVIETIDENQNSLSSSISVGKTDMYEITQPMAIKSIIFPYGVPQSIKVNICSYSKEGE